LDDIGVLCGRSTLAVLLPLAEANSGGADWFNFAACLGIVPYRTSTPAVEIKTADIGAHCQQPETPAHPLLEVGIDGYCVRLHRGCMGGYAPVLNNGGNSR
jgi:hypothetical protein